MTTGGNVSTTVSVLKFVTRPELLLAITDQLPFCAAVKPLKVSVALVAFAIAFVLLLYHCNVGVGVPVKLAVKVTPLPHWALVLAGETETESGAMPVKPI